MGLHSKLMDDLAYLKGKGFLNGFSKVVEIGAQQLSNGFLRDQNKIEQLYKAFDLPSADLGPEIGEKNTKGFENLSITAPSSKGFWESLGFNYTSIEFDGHRDSVALDLNSDGVPEEIRGTFHLLINTGTSEHIANQDNAFRVMHDLVGTDCIMIHHLPAGGLMDHGFINYNPKFFWHLCRENKYEIIALRIFSEGTQPIPQSILEENDRYGLGATDLLKFDEVPIFMLSAILLKRHDRPFVTPIDLPLDLVRKPPAPTSPESAIRSEDTVGPEDTVRPEGTVRPEDAVKPEDAGTR